MELTGLIDLPPNIASELSSALIDNKYITITGKHINTKGCTSLLEKEAFKLGKTVVSVDIPKKFKFSNKDAYELFSNAFKKKEVVFHQKDIKSLGHQAILIDNFQNLDDKRNFLVIVNNIQNLPSGYGQDLILGIRGLYQQRAQKPEARRLQFVLLGEKDPNEIRQKNSQATPYNIGERIKV